MSITAIALAASLVAPPQPVLIAPAALEHEHNAQCVVTHPETFGLPRSMSSISPASVQAEVDENGLYVIDLAVWYRPSWADAIGKNEVDNRVARWIETTNRIFRNSGVDARVNVLFAREMAYEFCVDENGFLMDVPRVNGECPIDTVGTLGSEPGLANSVGRMWMHAVPGGNDESLMPSDYPMFHRTSAEYGADLHLWIQEGYDSDAKEGPLGTASTHGISASAVDQSTAPINGPGERDVYEDAITATGHTIAHEIGHNLGLQHEFDGDDFADVGIEPDAFAYHCGQGLVPGTATNVMWSVGNPSFLRREIYSSPDLFIDDEACGTYERENQARVANNRAPITASYAQRPEAMGQVRFSQEVYSSPYGRDSLVVTVVREGDLSEEAEVEVTAVDGGAVYGEHYSGLKQVVRFQKEQSDAVVIFELIEPVDASQTRTFDLKLQYPLRVSIDNQYALAVLQGVNDAPAQGDFSITPSLTLTERGEGELVVQRLGGSAGEAVLNVATVDGTALANVHYELIDTQVRFLDGEIEKTIPVRVFNTDSNREFSVRLTSLTNASVSSGTANIRLLHGQGGEVYFKFEEGREGVRVENCSPTQWETRPLRCYAINTADKPESTSISFELVRKFGDVGTTSVTIAAFQAGDNSNFPESTGNWDTPLEYISEATQTVFFEDGQTEGVVTFSLVNLPSDLTREDAGRPITLWLSVEIVDEERDLDFLSHPVVYEIAYTPVFEPVGAGDDDGDNDGDTGGDDNDGSDGGNDNTGDSGDTGNDSSSQKRSASAVHPLLLLLLAGGLLVRRRKQ